MLPTERRKQMIDMMKEDEVVTINHLIETFDISIETVRRDLNLLEKQGKIEKVYGGAKLKPASFTELAMDLRMMDRQDLKDVIGKQCASFIQDGDCIYIDSGSTTYHIAKYIKDRKNLIVVTNSIPVVNELAATDLEIIIIGGPVRNGERSVVSNKYFFNFDHLNIQKCFTCASGVTVENGVSDFNVPEVETRKAIIERSKEIFIAADSTKFGIDVMINVIPIDEIDYLITDFKINQKYVAEFDKTDVELIIAN